VRIWRTDSGQSEGYLEAKSGISNAWFSADDKLILADSVKGRLIWKAAGHAPVLAGGLGVSRANSKLLHSAASDLSLALDVSGGNIFVRDLTTREIVDLLTHGANITALDWSHDGRFIVSTVEDGIVRLWRRDTLSLISSMIVKGGPVYSAILLPSEEGILTGPPATPTAP